MPAVVAVVSDGSDVSRVRRPLMSQLRDLAAQLASLSDLDVLAVPVVAHDDRQLGENLRLLPEQIAAVFLTCTDSSRAREARRVLRRPGGRLVVTDQDTTAVAVTAAALAAMRRAGKQPHESEVAIVGEEGLPGLARLFTTAGVREVSVWCSEDARPDLIDRATVVVDLTGELPPTRRTAVVNGTDISALLALPGLLSALVATDARVLPAGVLLACARAVTSVTPLGRLLPDEPSERLVAAVAHAAQDAVLARRERLVRVSPADGEVAE